MMSRRTELEEYARAQQRVADTRADVLRARDRMFAVLFDLTGTAIEPEYDRWTRRGFKILCAKAISITLSTSGATAWLIACVQGWFS